MVRSEPLPVDHTVLGKPNRWSSTWPSQHLPDLATTHRLLFVCQWLAMAMLLLCFGFFVQLSWKNHQGYFKSGASSASCHRRERTLFRPIIQICSRSLRWERVIGWPPVVVPLIHIHMHLDTCWRSHTSSCLAHSILCFKHLCRHKIVQTQTEDTPIQYNSEFLLSYTWNLGCFPREF